MHILLVAPAAPPKNSPEALQVRRHLVELAKTCRITLVTTPAERGWTRNDPSLAIDDVPHSRIEVRLPFHGLMLRALGSRFCQSVHVPDKDAWITWLPKQVLDRLDAAPDIVYSRSSPFSAALLARDLARTLDRPWVMHLSDPWADSPYRKGQRAPAEDQRLEAACFADAAAVTLTTMSQVQYYARKYPEAARKLEVSPNVMPAGARGASKKASAHLHFVYTGALYGERRPTPLLEALRLLKHRGDPAYSLIKVSIAGNVTDDVRLEVQRSGLDNVAILGHLEQAAVGQLLTDADVLVSFEPDGPDDLLRTFFPSKLLDYLAANRPMLAFTPHGSEAFNLCTRGHGWSFQPSEIEGAALLLQGLAKKLAAGRWNTADYTSPVPVELTARSAAERLQRLFFDVTHAESYVHARAVA